MSKPILIAIAVLALLGLAGTVWLYLKSAEPVACTEEAKQCPDGSYVGRVPPKCDFAPCEGESGIVTGKVTVGPLCPVEPCDGEPVDFSANQVILESQANGREIIVGLQTDGTFYPTRVAPGTYAAGLIDCPWLGCDSSLPQTVTVTANQTTEVLIEIDTGIR